MAKKGLGSGLGASSGTSFFLPTLWNAPFYLYQRSIFNTSAPRAFDEESLQALADSVSQHGNLQPITVRRLSSGLFSNHSGENGAGGPPELPV